MFSDYMNFLRKNGRPLSEINEGSDEIALTVKDAFQALEIAKENQIPILGGDIISEDNKGNMIYAYQSWGDEYIYLDWSYSPVLGESRAEYVAKSNQASKEAILRANKVAERLGKKCLIVIVI